jgi:hypothetical protein
MFFTWLAIAIGSALIGFSIGIVVGYFLYLSDLQREIRNRDTRDAVSGTVEQVFNNARTVKVGLFNSSNTRVGDVSVDCAGTNVRVGDKIYC